MDSMQKPERHELAGYDLGGDEVAKSPITLQWEELQDSALFSASSICLSEGILRDQVDDLLKVWRGVIFDHPFLALTTKIRKRTRPIANPPLRVAKLFWPVGTARTKSDQAWFDYQHEIGLCHHRTKKDKTDQSQTLGHIRARDLLAFSAAIFVPMKVHLQRKATRRRSSIAYTTHVGNQ
jgi:hypothetical protein